MINLFFGYGMTLVGGLALVDVYLRGHEAQPDTLLLSVAIFSFGLALLTSWFAKRFR